MADARAQVFGASLRRHSILTEETNRDDAGELLHLLLGSHLREQVGGAVMRVREVMCHSRTFGWVIPGVG
ncbi:hypothetical protein MSAR_47440 [Mycolicibacterium sarraceniae]|uniref:Uncharacterized protein n=1 Tax=Mycolicibacterium sarraceniae TaxID=1534348 RepID=A0A7I7SXT1_9MYCO|nr:hypothetical protein MSAR_47440 [Mycolicibacterium sarraceniae]